MAKTTFIAARNMPMDTQVGDYMNVRSANGTKIEIENGVGTIVLK